MPANQTPRLDTTDKPFKVSGMEGLLKEADNKVDASLKNSASKSAEGRRKTIDRRDNNANDKQIKEERRGKDRRRKPITKKTKTEKQQELEEMKLQQYRKKILLAGCEPVMGFNYDYLAMDDYPENWLVSAARRDRDYWLLICAALTSIFLFGVLGIVPAGVAGVSCGLAVLTAFFAFSPMRRFFFKRPHLHVLLQKRKEEEFRALNHIRLLEGKDGLAWRCDKLKKYNSNLSKKIFSGLFRYSKERQLLSIIRKKKHIRLYLLLMIESQKAYKRLEKDYLEHHFSNMERGLDDRIDAEKAGKLEQTLNVPDNKA